MTHKSPQVIFPDIANLQLNQVEEFIETLGLKQEELLAGIRSGIRGDLDVPTAYQLVNQTLTYSSIAAQLSVLAHTLAVNRLKGDNA